MRLVAISAALVCAAAHAGFAEGVTIVLDFQEPQNQQSIAEMKREFAGVSRERTNGTVWQLMRATH